MDVSKILDDLFSKSTQGQKLPPTFFNHKKSLGLDNINNTCFVNVVLQALLHTMPLTTCLLEGKFEEIAQHLSPDETQNTSRILPSEASHILQEAESEKQIMLLLYYIKINSKIWTISTTESYHNERLIDSIRPSNFIREMREHLPLYEWGRQHDAQETLIWLLNSFHDCLSRLVVHRIEGEPSNKLDKMRIEATLQWANNYKKQSSQKADISQKATFQKAHDTSSKSQVEILLRDKYLEYQSEYSRILKIFGGQFLERLNCEGCNEINHKYVSFLTSELALPKDSGEKEKYEKDEISIEKLLEHQCSLEKLDAENCWTCDKCKIKNEPFRRMSYWQLPQILILSLKRFSYEQVGNDFYSKKINTIITYDPFNFLDMDPYLSNSLSETKFVLYAIICHRGTLDGGHYYAFCRNLNSEKPVWFKYNDDEVSVVKHLDQLITKDAYILFYQRLDTLVQDL